MTAEWILTAICILIFTTCLLGQPNLSPSELTTPFSLRIEDNNGGYCYLAMGNSATGGDHSLAANEINVFFDCDDDGYTDTHYWTYQNGHTLCSSCTWFLYSASYGSNGNITWAQFQWDWSLGEGFQINNNEINAKIDYKLSAPSEAFYFNTEKTALYTYNDRDYNQQRLCVFQQSDTKNQYNKWINASYYKVVSGYEAKFNCNQQVQPTYFVILIDNNILTTHATMTTTTTPITTTTTPITTTDIINVSTTIPNTYIMKEEFYSHVYHDQLIGWNQTGNVSVVSDSNCPSQTLLPVVNKICISESYNSFWDGQYVLKQENKQINSSIYYNINSNKYIYHHSNIKKYTYYMIDYQSDNIMKTQCIIHENNTDITNCTGKWSFEENMISTYCNDICVYGFNNSPYIPNITRFTWSYYNNTHRTNVYHCQECVDKEVYLYGLTKYFHLTPEFWWIITDVSINDCDDCTWWKGCKEGANLGVDYVFELDYCSQPASWDCCRNAFTPDWIADSDILVTECPLQIQTESTTLVTGKVCVSNCSESSLNGEYTWTDYYLDGSIYYNAKTDAYIYPHITQSGQHQYHIQNANTMVLSKCNITSISFSDVSYCIAKWETNYNNTNIFDVDMVTTECDEICINGNDYYWIRNGAIFVYNNFDKIRKTNIYYCSGCVHPFYLNGWYLYGWIDNQNNYFWTLGPDYDSGDLNTWCTVGQNLGNNYIFDINHCLNDELWIVNDGRNISNDHDMIAYKCTAQLTKTCIKLRSRSQVSKTYSINKNYKNYAIGFDIDAETILNRLIIYYSCITSTNLQILSIFSYPFAVINTVDNVVYALPNSCDNSSSITIQFEADILNVYIDDFSLYYNVDKLLFFDNMNNDSNWVYTSESINATYSLAVVYSNEYCISDGYCYKMYVSSGRYAYLAKTISLGKTHYHYKDLNLEWSLKTSRLTKDATFNVSIQCSNNYFYVYDLCLLKQYDYNNDCTDNLCAVQSYILPYECDFSSELIISFYLESTTPTNIVYIDYVQLTHSDASDNFSPLCRTLSPTSEPTIMPSTQTLAPSYSPITKEPTVSPQFKWKISKQLSAVDYAIIAASCLVGLSLIATLLICIKICRNKRRDIEMAINNAMVILIAIGEYSVDESETHDENIGYLSDLSVEQDIVNLSNLFGSENLNYSIFPKYNLEYPQLEWSQKQIIDLLKEKAKELHEDRISDNSIYDALIVAISCHGLSNSICTSDYQLISKNAIHRLFSTQYAEIREIPRIFMFDSCEGSFQQGAADSDSDQSDENDKGKTGNSRVIYHNDEIDNEEQKFTEMGKSFVSDDIDAPDTIWTYGTRNPDHKLVIIHASNPGFVSKLDSRFGSYMLHGFVNKTLQDLNDEKRKNTKYLYEIFDEIQQELANKGKQQIVTTYNDLTRFIKLNKNKNKNMDNKIGAHKLINQMQLQSSIIEIDDQEQKMNVEMVQMDLYADNDNVD
eukprot:162866_1